MAARLVVLALFVAGCQCWSVPSVNQGRRAQYYTQKTDGSYQYGYDTAEGLYQSQEGDSVNEVRGQFGADGGKVEYTAGVGGYVVTSLKKPDAAATKAYVNTAPVRYATLEELATHPEQVDDTAEVKAAKASFEAAYNAAAASAEAAPDVNIITGPAPVVSANAGYSYSAPAVQTAYLAPAVTAVKYSGPAAPLDASGRVDDTADVKAAKASFQAAYNAAAAAAEAAPDVNIITGPAPVVSANAGYSYSAPAVQTAYLAPAVTAVKYSGPAAPLDASGRVDDTVEVKAAKASFVAAYNAAAAAAEAAPDVNIITGPAPVVSANAGYSYSAPAVQTAYLAPAFTAVKYSGPAAPLDASGRVDDTAEVKAAKASFVAAYNAAAAAAEAAPDTDIITAPVVAPAALYSVPAAITVKQTKPVEIAHVRSSASDDGSYQFSYVTSSSSRHESADAANNVYGNFEFVADDAQRRRVEYKAGAETGFVASGAHLPVSVADTAEVAAAKASFKSAFESAAAAAAAAPDDDTVYSAPAAPVPVQPAYIAPAPLPVITTTYTASKPAEIADFRSTSTTDGSYEFSYSTSDSARHESADAANNVYGNFEFVADDAQRRRVQYKAGAETGFVASGAHLPVSVADTAEVAAAKASFKSAFESAAAAAAAAPDDDIVYTAPAVQTAYLAPAVQTAYLAPAVTAVKYSGPAAPLDASGRVDDTAEVKAAKASFQAAYNALAAAAEAAPDVNIITGPAPVVSANAGYSYSAPAVQTAYLAPAVTAVKYSGPAAPLDASGRVDDTAEVKAAKASFQAAYNAAAAAAEAAPDTDIITAPVAAPAALYSVPATVASQTSYSGSHGNMRTVSFDGITLMQGDGPIKFGYSYE